MAENSTQTNFGRIFRNYVRPTKNGDKVNLPVLCGSPSTFVNVILSPGETVDLISALQNALNTITKGG